MVETATLSNTQKMALILTSLPEEDRVSVLKNWSEADALQVLKEMIRLPPVDDTTRSQVLQEFSDALAQTPAPPPENPEAVSTLQKLFGRRAPLLLETLKSSEEPVNLEGLLEEAGPDVMATALEKEHPGVISMILKGLSPKNAARVLSRLPEALQPETVRLMSRAAEVPQEVVDNVRRGIAERLTVKKDGPVKVKLPKEKVLASAQILSQLTGEMSKKILKSLQEKDQELGEVMEQALFTFDDLVLIQDRDLQRVLAKVNQNDLKLALRKCVSEVQEKIFKNMSQRIVAMIKEDMANTPAQKFGVVLEAQRKIAGFVREMIEKGEITVQRQAAEVAAQTTAQGPVSPEDELV